MPVTAIVVDDSAATRQIIGYHLHHAGCAVIGQATNAADALALFHKLKPKVVSLDLIMPVKDDIDSLQLIHLLKKEDPEVVIIVVSAIPSERIRGDYLREGVFAYIVKPFNDYALNNISLKLRRTFPEIVTDQAN